MVSSIECWSCTECHPPRRIPSRVFQVVNGHYIDPGIVRGVKPNQVLKYTWNIIRKLFRRPRKKGCKDNIKMYINKFLSQWLLDIIGPVGPIVSRREYRSSWVDFAPFDLSKSSYYRYETLTVKYNEHATAPQLNVTKRHSCRLRQLAINVSDFILSLFGSKFEYITSHLDFHCFYFIAKITARIFFNTRRWWRYCLKIGHDTSFQPYHHTVLFSRSTF